MNEVISGSPLLTLGIPSGLFMLLLSLGGYVWRASARVTIAETKLAFTTEQLTRHEESSAKAIEAAKAEAAERDGARKTEVAEVKESLKQLSIRHESAVTSMGQFREYVAQTLVTDTKLRETEGRLSEQIKENRETTGGQISLLGQKIDQMMSRSPRARSAG